MGGARAWRNRQRGGVHPERAPHLLGLVRRGGQTPHMAHCHTVHLPLGALLIPRTMCGYRWENFLFDSEEEDAEVSPPAS